MSRRTATRHAPLRIACAARRLGAHIVIGWSKDLRPCTDEAGSRIPLPDRALDQLQESIMKKAFTTLVGALALGAVWPASAGPDWPIIEKARMAKQAIRDASPGSTHGAMMKCSPDALTLPLDHGPRAHATPYQNQLRKQERAKTCANATT